MRTLADLDVAKAAGLRALLPEKIKILVGMASCGQAAGGRKVLKAIREAAAAKGLDAIVAETGCLGFCKREPIVDVFFKGRTRVTYEAMTPELGARLVDALAGGRHMAENVLMVHDAEEFLINGEDARRYQANGLGGELKAPPMEGIPFFKKQMKIVLRNCGIINPESIEEYVARGGYYALHKALTQMKPEEVIDAVTRSGLRGRGGAGFPTGTKWKLARDAKGEEKFIICNADEGDPGAYMDRSVLEGDPHTVIEGMLIAAYAIGATEGYVYARTEYPLAIKMMKEAIRNASEQGLLGSDIFGTGFGFTIKIAQGAGAFVCGEETALIASIEGRPPEPRPRPPFPANEGLWGKPTNVNNVETWANIPPIIMKGPEWYSAVGMDRSRGTKVFSLVGMVNNTGLVEVPMGITLREIIFDVGGGIPGGRALKAVQTGGPSGGCIPASMLDLPVDYEQLQKAGSIVGSGGMIVMDEGSCMVDVAKYFIEFTADESCGKCTSCREGLAAMKEVLERITSGNGREGDIEFLEELVAVVKDFSLCGLGGTAPNPVATTLRHFRHEYEAHIREKRCPAKVCKPMISYRIDAEKCTGCGLCAMRCPKRAISGERKKAHAIDPDACIKCGVCKDCCNFDAVGVE